MIYGRAAVTTCRSPDPYQVGAGRVMLTDDRLGRLEEVPHAGALAQELGVDRDAEVDTGGLAGTITITDHGVPEPATWAMMLLGFGAIGWQLRRRRSSLALAQAA